MYTEDIVIHRIVFVGRARHRFYRRRIGMQEGCRWWAKRFFGTPIAIIAITVMISKGCRCFFLSRHRRRPLQELRKRLIEGIGV